MRKMSAIANVTCFAMSMIGNLYSDEINEGDNQKESDLKKLDTIYTIGRLDSTSKYQGRTTLDSNVLESNPTGNGDITSILRILPNVQFDNSQLKSTTPGEIDPANISISGGLYYQNSFLLDGFNINNDLDPAISGGNLNPASVTALPGRSQGLNIDTSLLESISVQDSNVSAAYGGFSGGKHKEGKAEIRSKGKLSDNAGQCRAKCL